MSLANAIDSSASYGAVNTSMPVKITMSLAMAMAIYGPAPQIVQAHGVDIVTNIHDVGDAVAAVAPDGSVPAKKAKLLRSSVAKFKSVEENWDGEGAVQPHSRNVDKLLVALDLLPADLLDCIPMIASDGEVGVYWSRGDDHAELSVDPDGEVTLYLRDLSEEHGFMFELSESPYLSADMVNHLRARIG